LFPNTVRDTGAKTRAWFEIRPLGCRESAGSNLARSNEPLLSGPNQVGSASRHVDQIHLSLFTADYVPVQRSGRRSVISHYHWTRSDCEYLKSTPSTSAEADGISLLWETARASQDVTRFFPVVTCARWKPRLGSKTGWVV